MSRQQQQLSSMPSLTPSHDHHQLDAISSADLSLQQQQPMSSVVVMTPRRKQLNSAGKSVPGCLTKIANADGYLSTGDVGHTDKFGFVYITGRIKEILITAGGENVAPVLIEDNIKAELPIVSHAMVVGDGRKFLSILLTLRTEVDPDTQEPLPILTRPTWDICESYGLSLAETVTDVICVAERGMA